MSVVNRLIEYILKNHNPSHSNMAGVIMQGNKQIGMICGNNLDSYKRGVYMTSIHVEMKAIMNYFGKHLQYSPKHGWRQSYIKERTKDEYNGS